MWSGVLLGNRPAAAGTKEAEHRAGAPQSPGRLEVEAQDHQSPQEKGPNSTRQSAALIQAHRQKGSHARKKQ